MKSLTVQIPTPCHERWADMLPNDKGRFCTSCQKTVVDYTALSDRELVRVLSRSSGEICGQLRPDQINRPLVIPTQENSVWQYWLSVLTMGVLSWQTAQGQQGPITSPARTTTIQPLKPLAIREVVPEDTNQVIVSGRVMSVDSTGAVAVLLNATVHVMLPDLLIPNQYHLRDGQTDNAGRFRITLPADWSMDKVTINVFGTDFSTFRIHPNVTSTTPLITLSDIILTENMRVKHRTVSGGGLTIVKSPSRWQRIRRRLFHRAG